MKLKIFNSQKENKGEIKLPPQFDESIRKDIVKRAVLALQANRRQDYGSDPKAGQRASSKVSRRRRDYRGAYGMGVSRVPRKIMSRRGTRMNWVAATAPGTVGGRRAHPPKAEKNWVQKINKKENRMAIRSAMSATVIKDVVDKRGHKVPNDYPFVLDNDFEKLAKTKDVIAALMKLGFENELERSSVKKVRSGKGKSRGRKYQKRKGLLLVVSQYCNCLKSAKNIPGIDVKIINRINAELLAPGCDIGRATLFTKSAIEKLDKEKLFM